MDVLEEKRTARFDGFDDFDDFRSERTKLNASKARQIRVPSRLSLSQGPSGRIYWLFRLRFLMFVVHVCFFVFLFLLLSRFLLMT